MIKTTTIEMGRLAHSMLGKVEDIFKKQGFTWDPHVINDQGDITIELIEGLTWSPCRGLVMVRHIAPDRLLRVFLHHEIYPVMVT